MKTLTIKLAGPLQSYGDQATFDHRTTYSQPSKSAIVGMIAAALGYERTDPRIKKLNSLLFTTRTDQQGKLITDFQTVKSERNAHRKLTYRQYWSDAIFMVAIASENEQLIDQIAHALKHPVFQLFLGRRGCPMTNLPEIKTYNNQTPIDVLKSLPWQAAKWYQKQLSYQESAQVKLTADAELLPNTPNKLVKDVIGSLDPAHRYYTYRPVATTFISLENLAFKVPKVDENITSQDIFSTINN